MRPGGSPGGPTGEPGADPVRTARPGVPGVGSPEETRWDSPTLHGPEVGGHKDIENQNLSILDIYIFFLRPHHSGSVVSDPVQSELTVLLRRDRDDFQTPSSPNCCLGKDCWTLTVHRIISASYGTVSDRAMFSALAGVDDGSQMDAGPDLLPALQHLGERQLPAGPQVMGEEEL